MTPKKKTEKMVIIPDNIVEEMKKAPQDVQDELEKMIQGFMSGEIDPAEVGDPVTFELMSTQLRCDECDSEEMEWREMGKSEVHFDCPDCGRKGWTELENYERAIRENPGQITNGKLYGKTN